MTEPTQPTVKRTADRRVCAQSASLGIFRQTLRVSPHGEEPTQVIGCYRLIAKKQIFYMLYTIVVILFALWLVGVVAGMTIHGLIHLLLVLAVIILLFNLFAGRKRVS